MSVLRLLVSTLNTVSTLYFADLTPYFRSSWTTGQSLSCLSVTGADLLIGRIVETITLTICFYERLRSLFSTKIKAYISLDERLFKSCGASGAKMGSISR
jgi:hypothetical protein